MGVMVENGIIKEGTPICVPSKEVNNEIPLTFSNMQHTIKQKARSIIYLLNEMNVHGMKRFCILINNVFNTNYGLYESLISGLAGIVLKV